MVAHQRGACREREDRDGCQHEDGRRGRPLARHGFEDAASQSFHVARLASHPPKLSDHGSKELILRE